MKPRKFRTGDIIEITENEPYCASLSKGDIVTILDGKNQLSLEVTGGWRIDCYQCKLKKARPFFKHLFKHGA